MRSPLLDELPETPGKVGWPWTEPGRSLPATLPDGAAWPKISIVTANYNYGRFLEETLRSVLLQGYPNLEFIVIDGGSTDESVEIIRRYEPWLSHWVSEPDEGHVDAIKKGLRHCTGEWFNWLNSDDILLKGALETVAMLSRLEPEAGWISGANLFLSEYGTPVEYYAPWRTDPTVLGFGWPNFPQDATFVRLALLREAAVELVPNLATFDTVFYWRLIEHSFPLLTSACLSAMRLHSDQVTADAHRRSGEIESWIVPRRRRMPIWIRVWYHLLKSRYLSGFFQRLLAASVWYGLSSTSRSARAVVYDHRSYEWRRLPARARVLY